MQFPTLGLYEVYAQNVHSCHTTIQAMSAIRRPTASKTSTFSHKDKSEKHFH